MAPLKTREPLPQADEAAAESVTGESSDAMFKKVCVVL